MLLYATIHFTYLILFHTCISYESDVIMNVKTEQRARFAPSLVDDKVIERVMLCAVGEGEAEVRQKNGLIDRYGGKERGRREREKGGRGRFT